MHAPDKGPETALDLLTLALPYVEDAESDPAYKKGIVAILTKRMRAMIEAPDKTATAALIANLHEFHSHGNPKIHFGALANDYEDGTTIGDLVTLAHCEQHSAPKIAENRTGELLALLEQVRPYVEYYHEREGCDFTLSALRSALEKGGN